MMATLPATDGWQKTLAQGFTHPSALLDYLELSPQDVSLSQTAHQAFKTKVPRGFAEKMTKKDPHDPLLRQVLPIANEEHIDPNYTVDPLQETAASPLRPLPGLLHKYHGRVLLTVSGGCAINCRYCFRRHFDYADNHLGKAQFSDVLTYLKTHPDIREVIFSGGDPLLLKDTLLHGLIKAIESIPSITLLRFHTRLPIVLPERITPTFISILQQSRLQTVCVLHANHPNELDQTLYTYLTPLRVAGTHLLNQSVLLKGVNDNIDTLCQLSYSLLKMGVLPYYLHLPDKVAGTQHFDVCENEALALHHAMREQLPGYLLPRLVREIPGEKSKSPIHERKTAGHSV